MLHIIKDLLVVSLNTIMSFDFVEMLKTLHYTFEFIV